MSDSINNGDDDTDVDIKKGEVILISIKHYNQIMIAAIMIILIMVMMI